MSEWICTKNLKKTYGIGENAVYALRGTDVTFEKGSFNAIVGTSGSGKSTLLQLLGGLDCATEGEVLYDGQSILTLPDEQLSAFRRKHIGFIFQFFNLIPELTAKENIILPLLIDGQKPDEALVSALAERLGLSDRLTHLPSQLSGGQQQRVAIARALLQKPDVLLCDEPTGNLDQKSSAEVIALFRQIQQEDGQTVIIVTHDPQIAAQAERVIRIEDGRIMS